MGVGKGVDNAPESDWNCPMLAYGVHEFWRERVLNTHQGWFENLRCVRRGHYDHTFTYDSSASLTRSRILPGGEPHASHPVYHDTS